MSIGWLTAEEARTLQETARLLRQRRMMASLVPGEQADPADTRASEGIFKCKMGETSRPLP
jgi:hypothetical protein